LKRYEVIAIAKPDLIEEGIAKLIERIEKIIFKHQGIIAKIDKWGKKRLAYEIKKYKEGHYFLFDFAGDGPLVSEIERNYKIDDRIKKDGAVTREGIDAEIAAAETKKELETKAGEAPASAEEKTIQPAEQSPANEKPRRSTVKKIAKKETEENKED